MPRRKLPEDQFNLKEKPYWRNIKLQFNQDELELVIILWNQFIAQFKEDVLATEEMQILDLIKVEILLNRLLKEQNSIMEKKNLLEALVAKMEADDDCEPMEIQQENMKINALRSSYDNISSEIRDTLKEKNKQLENLKATRSARIQKIDGKQTFGLWYQQMNNDYDLRKRMGLAMEKMRLASEAEKKRLGKYHEYANGEFDRPFLTPESVEQEEEDNE